MLSNILTAITKALQKVFEAHMRNFFKLEGIEFFLFDDRVELLNCLLSSSWFGNL